MPSTRAKKLALWSRLLLTSPAECMDRLSTVMESRKETGRFATPSYNVQPFATNIQSLSLALKTDLNPFLDEPAIHEIEREISERLARTSARDAIDRKHNADPGLARCCYALCRALKPQSVVETGVAYGITTAYILKAMDVNGAGNLSSVDLPPLAPNADESTGRAVPEYLRSRWTLHRGKSNRVLPSLVQQAGPIDLFIHDSLHTYQNELFEFETAWPQIRANGVLVSDDIEEHPAWLHWEEKAHPAVSVVFEENKSQGNGSGHSGPVSKFGIMVKR